MDLPTIFVVDLRESREEAPVCSDLTSLCKVYSVIDLDVLNCMIETNRPDVICFEFDLPEDRSLSAIDKTKRLYPSIPVLMVTEYHDEQLAVWALRARVWDYFVKPVSSKVIYQSINMLTELRSSSGVPREIVKPQQFNANAFIKSQIRESKTTAFNVIRYVESHYHEKIYISELAEQCHISTHQFSRVFKREKGVTFRDYLAHYRLDKACELLKESSLSVGDVGYAVGFTDHSYFARVFRRHVGVSPSDYRLRKQ